MYKEQLKHWLSKTIAEREEELQFTPSYSEKDSFDTKRSLIMVAKCTSLYGKSFKKLPIYNAHKIETSYARYIGDHIHACYYKSINADPNVYSSKSFGFVDYLEQEYPKDPSPPPILTGFFFLLGLVIFIGALQNLYIQRWKENILPGLVLIISSFYMYAIANGTFFQMLLN